MKKLEFSPSYVFQEMVRLAVSTDWYEDLCVHCHRVTRWAHSGTVAGTKWYTCCKCGATRRTPNSRKVTL
jgi:hypothetical protein